jgi:CRISPR/Cas system-associated protein Cas7 (RAMP superfamily)
MGGACSTYGERRSVYRVLLGKLKEGDHLGDPGADGRIILRWIFRKWDVGLWPMDWIELAEYRNRWRALVTAVMNLRVSKSAGNFLTS